MIIRKGSTPQDIQAQVKGTSKFKRGFNQKPEDITNNMNVSKSNKQNNQITDAIDLQKKMNALKHPNKWN